MKVVHVFISMPVGGAEDLVLSLVRASSPEFQVQAVCLRELGMAGEEALKQGLNITLFPVARRRQMNPFGVWRLSRWLRQSKADVVHTHVYNAHVYGVLAARITGIPAVMHHHKTFNRSRRRRWFIMRWLAKLAKIQITLSEQTREDIISALHLPTKRVFTLPNAVDRSVFHPAPNRTIVRRSIGLSENELLLGGVASLTAQKNHAATVKMSGELSRRGIRFQCVICGEGPLRKELEKGILAQGLENFVRLAGNQRPIHPWLQSLDILLLPSTWEGQPLILLQATACNIPIIASRIEGNVAALGTTHPGLFSLERPQDYAELVWRVIKDVAFKNTILEHQRNVFHAQPTLETYAARLNEIYRSLF